MFFLVMSVFMTMCVVSQRQISILHNLTDTKVVVIVIIVKSVEVFSLFLFFCVGKSHAMLVKLLLLLLLSGRFEFFSLSVFVCRQVACNACENAAGNNTVFSVFVNQDLDD